MNKLQKQSLRKVPEITLIFWIVKLLTTAMGEATSDYLVAKVNPYFAVLLGAAGLLGALLLQFRSRRYTPWKYWLTVSMVAIFGTMAADGLHVQLGVPYVLSTGFFAIVLSVLFFIWHKREGTLSIHSITSRSRESFYWATVLATFALGTAAGDMTASTLRLGYLSSAILFLILISIPIVAFWKLKLNSIIAFWLAYILTRPLGASVADWMGKARAVEGLGLGDGHVSLVLIGLITVMISYVSLKRRGVKA